MYVDTKKMLLSKLEQANEYAELPEKPNLNQTGINWMLVNSNYPKILPNCEAGMSAKRLAHQVLVKLGAPRDISPRDKGSHIIVPKNFDRVKFIKTIEENLPKFTEKGYSVINSAHGIPILPRRQIKVEESQSVKWAALTEKEEFALEFCLCEGVEEMEHANYNDGLEMFKYIWSKLDDEQRKRRWMYPEIVLPKGKFDKYGVLLNQLDPNGVNEDFVVHAARLRASNTLKDTWSNLLTKDKDKAEYTAAKIITSYPTKNMPDEFYKAGLASMARVTSNPALQAKGALDCYRNKKIDISELVKYGERINPEKPGKHGLRVLTQIEIEVSKYNLTTPKETTTEIDIF